MYFVQGVRSIHQLGALPACIRYIPKVVRSTTWLELILIPVVTIYASLSIYLRLAIASISNKTPLGSLATSTADLAGLCSPKNLE